MTEAHLKYGSFTRVRRLVKVATRRTISEQRKETRIHTAHSINNQIHGILLEKLMVTHLVKKFPAIYGNHKVYYSDQKSPTMHPALNQINQALHS
jgi:hypothetical protein